MSGYFDILITGAGHGGSQAAISLRQNKFVGSICMVGEEPELPYERPPLSKTYLGGTKSFDQILIRPPAFWTERGIDVLTCNRVASVDPEGHAVKLQDGATIRYGRLIWATGGRPRRLICPGHDLVGVHTVRSRADVDRMISELSGTMSVVIVGGGYIGLEAAAVLAKLGKRVSVLEMQDRVLARVAGPTISHFYEAEHRAHGVDVLLNSTVACIEERDGRAAGVRLIGGEVIPAEMVIVGIGILPAVEPLLQAGLKGGNGVEVDQLCRTSSPDIFAIGDCALHSNLYAGGQSIRLESVQNASDQANVVARELTGSSRPYDAVPWFWSDQFDLRLQTVGLSAGHDQEVSRGNLASRSFSIVYLKKGRVIALDCVNATRDFVQGKALVACGARVGAAALSVASTSLKTMLYETSKA
jgi:3-phenylpropionate/trans-cinnamate dioxygenase ferredoxin reductase subunit